MTKRLFDVGQPVICIDDDFSWARKRYPDARITYPKFAGRYVVRAYLCDGKVPAIALQEIHNPDVIYQDGHIREAGFADKRFVCAPPPLKETTNAKKELETT